MKNLPGKTTFLVLLTILLSVVISTSISWLALGAMKSMPRIAYIDTSVMLKKINIAKEVDVFLQRNKTEFTNRYAVLQDSLKSATKEMAAKYESAGTKGKEELRLILEERNKQLSRYHEINLARLDSLQRAKMDEVFVKLNSFITEYGRENGYDLILGTTAGGNILYGNSEGIDITDEVAQAVNRRF